MNKKKKIYKVQFYDGTANNHYYVASDINAIFELKFDYKEKSAKSVELLDGEFIGTCDENDRDKKLFYATLSTDSSFYIIANDMKDAYKLLYVNIGDMIKFFNSIDYIAPIRYIRSFMEIDNEVESMRIG